MNDKLKRILQDIMNGDNSKTTAKGLLTRLFETIINDENLYKQVDFTNIIQYIADSVGVVLDGEECDSFSLEDVIQLIILEEVNTITENSDRNNVPIRENSDRNNVPIIGGMNVLSPAQSELNNIFYSPTMSLSRSNNNSMISRSRFRQRPANYRFNMRNGRNGFGHTPSTVGDSGCNGFKTNNPNGTCYGAM
jgi:hypothetical protein